MREAVSASVSGFALMTDSPLKDALESFFTDRLADVPAEVGRKIDTVLRLATMGGLPTAEAISQVQELLGSARRRAMTLVNTEMSRAFSVAAAQRASENEAAGVPMVKTWRRSGKIHSRLRHDIADGQTVPQNKPFKLGPVSMKHPHDPAAPASETINCGCLALYRRADYAPTLPEKRPFTEQEIALNPNKAELVQGKTIGELLAALPNVVRTAASDGALLAFSKEIGPQELEHSIFVDANGEIVLRKIGFSDRIEYTPDELSLIKGTAMAHTHPGVGSFSSDDVLFAMAHQLADMRVVDAWYAYRIEPPATGWNAVWWRDVVEPIVAQVKVDVKNDFKERVAKGELLQVASEAYELHEVWSRVSKMIGLRYTMEIL